MKRNLAKIFASASIVVAIILIAILLTTAFGGINDSDYEGNHLAKGLLVTLSVLYLLLGAIVLILLFVKSESVKEITIRLETSGTVRISSAVITKLVKKACVDIEGVKCKKVVVTQDDYGVRLKISIKVVDRDVVEVETYLRTLLEDMFVKEFGFRFSTIEIKVMELTPKYKADTAAIQAEVDRRLEERKAQAEKEAEQAEQEAKDFAPTVTVEEEPAAVEEEKEPEAEPEEADEAPAEEE